MNKGDKFIVVDNSTNLFKLGETIIYQSLRTEQPDGNHWYKFSNETMTLYQVMTLDQINLLDRFPCDDEQPN